MCSSSPYHSYYFLRPTMAVMQNHNWLKARTGFRGKTRSIKKKLANLFATCGTNFYIYYFKCVTTHINLTFTLLQYVRIYSTCIYSAFIFRHIMHIKIRSISCLCLHFIPNISLCKSFFECTKFYNKSYYTRKNN